MEIAILKGVLSANMVGINYVNAPVIAKQRGIIVKTSKINDNENSIKVVIETSEEKVIVKGTLIAKDIKRITQINSYITSIEPKNHMLFVPHINKPNMVAKVAGVIGSFGINISGMQVAQSSGCSDKSIMIINTDTEVNMETLNEIVCIEGVDDAKYIGLHN